MPITAIIFVTCVVVGIVTTFICRKPGADINNVPHTPREQWNQLTTTGKVIIAMLVPIAWAAAGYEMYGMFSELISGYREALQQQQK